MDLYVSGVRSPGGRRFRLALFNRSVEEAAEIAKRCGLESVLICKWHEGLMPLLIVEE